MRENWTPGHYRVAVTLLEAASRAAQDAATLLAQAADVGREPGTAATLLRGALSVPGTTPMVDMPCPTCGRPLWSAPILAVGKGGAFMEREVRATALATWQVPENRYCAACETMHPAIRPEDLAGGR